MAQVEFDWTCDYVLVDLVNSNILPFNQVPMLIDRETGIKLVQSCAIVRYLSHKYGFYPGMDHPKELAINEQMMEQHVDMYNAIRNTNAEKSVEGWRNLVNNVIPKHLRFCEKILSDIGPTDQYPFFSRSTSPKMGDLAIFSILNFIIELFPGMICGYPLLNQFYQTCSKIPQIAQYLSLNLPIYFVNPLTTG